MNEPVELDMTPLLDVVFIMLIFFIVTASFVKEIGLDLPANDAIPLEKATEKKTILVEIRKDNRFYLAGRQVDQRLIGAHIGRLHAQLPEAPLVIRPDPQSKVKRLVQVMDAGRQVDEKLKISIAEM